MKYHDHWNYLRTLIQVSGVIRRPEIKLTSGKTTSYYYDIKKIALMKQGMDRIGRLGAGYVEQLHVNSIGGLETGSIPISIAIANTMQSDIQAFYIRRKPKQHGLEKQIEGIVVDPVLVVEDVTNTGKSALEACKILRKDGHVVCGVLSIVDRRSGARKLLKSHGLKLYSIFTDRNIIPKYYYIPSMN
jgi:orotate phosphoribosyltransferase